MKNKIYKLMGVALVVVLLASLTVGLSTAPAGADPGKLKWEKLTLPRVGDDGDYWTTPGLDPGPIAIAPDGDIMFASLNDGADWWVMKSTDGGYSWVDTGFYDEWSDITNDGTMIMDIVVSPDYEEDTTVLVATEYTVYQSVDGGKKFVCMEDPPDWDDGATTDSTIRDLDVALDDRGRLAYMVGTTGVGGDPAGDVYVFATATGMKWEAEEIDIGAPDDYDVVACAFSPNFADDEGIAAVVFDDTAGTTAVRFSFAYLGEDDPGDGWDADIMDAEVTDAEGLDFVTAHARIAFPDDFNPWGIGNNVCFVGIYSLAGWNMWNETDPDVYYDAVTGAKGDVYKIVLKEAGTSSAVDLDIRGVITTLLPTVTDIMSIDVCGDAEDATIVVGTDRCDMNATPEQYLVYYSTDGGETWDEVTKSPTGGEEYTTDLQYFGALTDVVMAPDFCDSGIAYASTWGDETSALSRTSDSAESWNQISLIDYCWTGDYYVKDVDVPGYNAEGAVRITTLVGGSYGAIWDRTGGKHWERILSYANPNITDNITELRIKDGAMFAIDFGSAGNPGYIWRSPDNGATWPKKITTKDDVSEVMPISETTIYTGHTNGEVWWSTKSGVGWTKPDDSEIPSTTTVADISVRGDIVLIGSSDGSIYISSDGGETIERVGMGGPSEDFGGPPTLESYDLGFDANHIIYATQIGVVGVPPLADTIGVGVWRTEVDLDDPHGAEWDRIDDIDQPNDYDPDTLAAAGPFITLPPMGVGYVIDNYDVDTDPDDDAGGLWRCANPTADIDGAHPPYFERENKGLENGDNIGMKDLDLAAPPSLSPTLFTVNDDPDYYYEQVLMFTDTLNFGVPLTDPTDGETGVGLLPAGGVYPKVDVAWQTMAGALSYQWEIALDADFNTVVDEGFTDDLAEQDIQLSPNKNYYWRVRVAKEDDDVLLGAPLISPWATVWKFKTAIGAVKARPDLEAPWPGEPDVALSPTFEWSGIEWADKYEYELATDPGTTAGGYFVDVLVGKTGANSLVSTAWKCEITLDYETRYYWHVKAIGVDTETPWSDVGTFTTMSVPPEAPEPVPPVQIPPVKEITPAWIWAIVIIGAILVIAVIVLIVTTRRVP